MEFSDLTHKQWLEALMSPDFHVEMLRCLLRVSRAHFNQAPRHYSNHLVLLIARGHMVATLDGQRYECQAGDVLWVPPGVKRVFDVAVCPPALVDYRIHFDARIGDAQLRFCDRPFIRHDAWEVQTVFQLLAQVHHSPKGNQNAHVRGLLTALSATIFDLPEECAGEGSLSAVQRLTVDSYTMNHIHEGITAADLARELGLTHDYFTRAFKRTYGMAPRSYLKRMRIQTAAHRLQDCDIRVNELATEMGFGDANLFTRQFREVMGCTPTAYRAQAAARQGWFWGTSSES